MQPPATSYEPPVDAPISDRFRPPPTPYAAGNRGIDFDTATGQPVLASAPGLVVFAGAVGRTRHVVVLHDDGLRTSYSFLHAVAVRRGQRVERGEVLGLAGETLHFGLRRGDTYLDPRAFLAGSRGRRGYARLVPDHDGGGGAPRPRGRVRPPWPPVPAPPPPRGSVLPIAPSHARLGRVPA